MVCACIYRPPNPNDLVYNQKISQAIGQIEEINANQYLICGDFNYPKIDWINHDLCNAGRDEHIYLL